MSNTPSTVGDLYQLDPSNIDTSEIKELSNAMPKDGNIDTNNAEILATKYLRGSDKCGELMAISVAYVSKTKDAKQKAYNYAFLVKSAEHKHIKTDKMRVAFAELDDDYQIACEDYNKALMFAKWIESKYSSFNKMHYMCRKILDRGYEGERASSWNGNVIEENGW